MYFAVFFSPLQITEYKCSVILNDISLRQLPETAVFVCVCVLSSFKTVFKHKNAFSMLAPKTGRILLSLVRMYESFYTLVSFTVSSSVFLPLCLSLLFFFSVSFLFSFVFWLFAEEEVENFNVSSLQEEVLRSIEADSFWCMSKLLDGIQVN